MSRFECLAFTPQGVTLVAPILFLARGQGLGARGIPS
jgi:hypothetical protein